MCMQTLSQRCITGSTAWSCASDLLRCCEITDKGYLLSVRTGGSPFSAHQASSTGNGLRSEQEGDEDDDDETVHLPEFPFFFDGHAAWVCRHCQHFPPQRRGGDHAWQSALPPPNDFVDMHLERCLGLAPRAALPEFPFFFDGRAAWLCRHCQHLTPQRRGGDYVWRNAAPPPNKFVDMHLERCPGLAHAVPALPPGLQCPQAPGPPVLQVPQPPQHQPSYPGTTLDSSDTDFYPVQQYQSQLSAVPPQQQIPQMQQQQTLKTQQQPLQPQQSLRHRSSSYDPQEGELSSLKDPDGGQTLIPA